MSQTSDDVDKTSEKQYCLLILHIQENKVKIMLFILYLYVEVFPWERRDLIALKMLSSEEG